MAAMLLLAYGLGVATSLLLSSHAEEKGTLVRFSLYAPKAEKVNLAGNFNGWSREGNPLSPQGDGVWSVTIPAQFWKI
jgi:1,4-alpha-glucan branching enzyme